MPAPAKARSRGVTGPGRAATTAGMAFARRMAVARSPVPSCPADWSAPSERSRVSEGSPSISTRWTDEVPAGGCGQTGAHVVAHAGHMFGHQALSAADDARHPETHGHQGVLGHAPHGHVEGLGPVPPLAELFEALDLDVEDLGKQADHPAPEAGGGPRDEEVGGGRPFGLSEAVGVAQAPSGWVP